jgi:hypothetical protein
MNEYFKNIWRFGFILLLTFPIIYYTMGWQQIQRVAYKSALVLVFLALAELSYIFFFKIISLHGDTKYDTWMLVVTRCVLYLAFVLGGCLGL